MMIQKKEVIVENNIINLVYFFFFNFGIISRSALGNIIDDGIRISIRKYSTVFHEKVLANVECAQLCLTRGYVN